MVTTGRERWASGPFFLMAIQVINAGPPGRRGLPGQSRLTVNTERTEPVHRLRAEGAAPKEPTQDQDVSATTERLDLGLVLSVLLAAYAANEVDAAVHRAHLRRHTANLRAGRGVPAPRRLNILLCGLQAIVRAALPPGRLRPSPSPSTKSTGRGRKGIRRRSTAEISVSGCSRTTSRRAAEWTTGTPSLS
jgi:hypothetical protein